MTTPDVDVAIVGYGPVGAAMANLLGMSGLKVAVLEREPSIYHMPRAISLDGESMRLFQTMGLAETLLPKLGISRNIRHVNAEGKLLVLIARGGIGPDGWNHAYRFYQPELEGVLRAGVVRYGNVDVRLRSDVFTLDERDDCMRIRYEDLSSGKLASLTSRYVVGCDGARSTVRRFMGAALQDLRSHERWIVLDMVLDTPPAGVPDAADETGQIVDAIQYCDPARPTTFIPMPGNRHRWEFMLMPGDDPVKIVQPDSIYNLLKPWKIDPATSQIERAVVYTFHSSLATKWRHGRLILAGDSAHQTPPFLGQGMGSGLRDVINLAWKLRDVVKGRSPDSLLDSYQTERMEHVRAYIEVAVELGGVIQTTDPDKARKRDAELLANPTMIRPLTPRLGPGLHGSGAAPAGTRAEQPTLGDGQRLDDRVGYRFAVLAAPDVVMSLSRETLAMVERIDAVVVPADGQANDYLTRTGMRALVLRPDRHILGGATTAAELNPILALVPSLIKPSVMPRSVANV
jgi:3-(3-hydroxy-phenyl)propionate hydroxylase